MLSIPGHQSFAQNSIHRKFEIKIIFTSMNVLEYWYDTLIYHTELNIVMLTVKKNMWEFIA